MSAVDCTSVIGNFDVELAIVGQCPLCGNEFVKSYDRYGSISDIFANKFILNTMSAVCWEATVSQKLAYVRYTSEKSITNSGYPNNSSAGLG